jgi:predicted DNA-binding transcriptional regulator AlpA
MATLQKLFNTHQVAEMFGIESKTLANSRSSGVGIGSIPFVKFGINGAVRYRESDVLAYIEANTKNRIGE